MTVFAVDIKSPVGVRDGVQMLTNNLQDLATITDLIDRIDPSNGGTSDSPGGWATDYAALVYEVAGSIATFQAVNSMNVDSAVDPRGRTLSLMNSLAADPPLVASVDPDYTDLVDSFKAIASPTSLPGTNPLAIGGGNALYTRFLVGLKGSSLKWFAVMIPLAVSDFLSATTHVFFTPTPDQHPAHDSDYRSRMVGRLYYRNRRAGGPGKHKSNCCHPIYKYTQTEKLGGFLSDWASAINAVVEAAITVISPSFVSGTFSIKSLVTSSFSNGIRVHMHFQTSAVGTTALTSVMFDLDGGASGTVWHQPA